MRDGATSRPSEFFGEELEGMGLEQLPTVVNAVDEGIYYLDPDGRFTGVNDAVVERTGYERAELVGAHASRLLHDEDVARIEREIQRRRETGEPRTERFDLAVRTADGGTVPCELDVNLVHRDGTFRGSIGVLREITDPDRAAMVADHRLATVMENVRGMVYRGGNERGWPMEFVSQGCSVLTGYSAAALERGEVSYGDEIVLERDREALWEEVQSQLDEDGAFLVTYRIETADGETRWVRERGHGTYEDGELVALEGVVIDVTDRKRAERRLAEERDVFTDGPVVVFRWEPDDEAGWPVEYVSENVESLLGYTAEELESGAVPYGDLLLEADVDRVRQEVQKHVESGSDRFSHDPYRIQTKEGAVRWVKDVTKIVRDERGAVERYLGYLVDITERKEHEQELERVRDRMEYALDATDAVIWDWNADEDVVSFYPSAESLYGSTVENWEDFMEVVHPEDREKVKRNVQNALETGEAKEEEIRIVRDGTVRWIDAPGHPVTDDDGTDRVVGVARDITERKTYEQKLEESNERLEQFAYAASHDLQEPLRMVSSYLQLVEERYDDQLDEDGKEYIDFAVDGAERMREMIDALLDYSRIETQGDPFEPVALEDVLEAVITDLEFRIAEQDAEVTVGELPAVEGDASQLRQVFQNLLENAIQYSGDEPAHVHVSATRTDGRWEIAVTDEGIGVDPSDQDRMFEVFERLHSRQEHEGTGIGLALCQRIVERHGGEIEVESEPGDGATFTVSLPATLER